MSAPCPYCKNGTTVGPNGERWRCFACAGSGKLKTSGPEPDPNAAQPDAEAA